jgi:endogenous inhibitor of DNA gyrase (YacG/DUF329 family)
MVLTYGRIEGGDRMTATIKCPHCGKAVEGGNFCEFCGKKMIKVCDCWITGKKMNCGRSQCPKKKRKTADLMPAVPDN